MMINGNPGPNDLRTTLAQKKAETVSLESKLNSLQDDIRALERVLGWYPNGRTALETPIAAVQVAASELRGKRTQKDALDHIAEKSGGYIQVGVAKQLLIEAGLVKGNPKYVYGHIYNMLKADDRYEPIGGGTFKKKQGSLALR